MLSCETIASVLVGMESSLPMNLLRKETVPSSVTVPKARHMSMQAAASFIFFVVEYYSFIYRDCSIILTGFKSKFLSGFWGFGVLGFWDWAEEAEGLRGSRGLLGLIGL